MRSTDSIEVYGYCRSREETERVMTQLDRAGVSETLIRVTGKGGRWQRVAKPRSVFKNFFTGLPVGAVVGCVIAVSMRSGHAGISRAHMDWLSIVALIGTGHAPRQNMPELTLVAVANKGCQQPLWHGKPIIESCCWWQALMYKCHHHHHLSGAEVTST
jgi:hypothetical protein